VPKESVERECSLQRECPKPLPKEMIQTGFAKRVWSTKRVSKESVRRERVSKESVQKECPKRVSAEMCKKSVERDVQRVSKEIWKDLSVCDRSDLWVFFYIFFPGALARCAACRKVLANHQMRCENVKRDMQKESIQRNVQRDSKKRRINDMTFFLLAHLLDALHAASKDMIVFVSLK